MGQAKKKKIECPAMGCVITPQECGEKRITTYACPESCPHNPWSPQNYDKAREIDGRLRSKMYQRLKDEILLNAGSVALPGPQDLDSPMKGLIYFTNKYYIEKDKEGLTLIDCWRAKGFNGLNNDQIVEVEAESRGRMALLEVHEIRDEKQVVCVDLLEPECLPFIIVDRALAASVCRFSCLLSFMFKVPFYSRVNGVGITIPRIGNIPPEKVLDRIVRKLHGPCQPDSMSSWLLCNLPAISDSLLAVLTARQHTMLSKLDVLHTAANYRMETCQDDILHQIDELEGMVPVKMSEGDSKSGFLHKWSWTEPGGMQSGRRVLADLLLHRMNYIQLRTFSSKQRKDMNARLKKALKGRIHFLNEVEDNLLTELLQKSSSYDAAIVPAELLKEEASFETTQTLLPFSLDEIPASEIGNRVREEFDSTFLDTPVPMLKGKTPRQAAAAPQLRAALINLMKIHVHGCDQENLANGTSRNINWMLDELKLNEINFPPPPPREPLADEDDNPDNDY